jgi:predicted AlkP superfamily pyrophosphatase or phosphodiesterase
MLLRPLLLASAFTCTVPPLSSRGAVPAAPASLVLISIDGFRADYIHRSEAANLRAVAEGGVRAEWMTPVFPSKTYPGHYTMVTGLWPERHGVVANTMRDSAIGYKFEIGNRRAVTDPRWWAAEPIWVAVERQGRRAAAFFWPGTETAIDGVRPTWWRRYDGSVPNAERIRQLLAWLSLPPDSAPALVTTYFGDVDRAGHDHGPDAPETNAAIARVDSAIGALVAGIGARGLGGKVNLVLVSDHGMAPVSRERTIYLDDYLDLRDVDVIDWSPVAALAPRGAIDAESLYRALHGRHPRLAVYRREAVPERYHYRAHPRIAPVLAVADDGWLVSSRRRDAASARDERGSHGYDPALPSMRALFVAQGPAFRSGAVVAPFGSVHVYALLCEVLGLRPAPHDGALDSVRAVLRD